MSKALIWIIAITLSVAGAIALSRMDASKPLAHVEKNVTAAASSAQ